MTENEKQELLGKALWDIANELRGAMNADDLIEAQTTKIEALKTHKKGLMQQLFPQSITN
ncbi:hypothetical protein BZG02_02870 [Labilibaculum filiforme]|uniref:Uncharacterized protein n=1 Tax=Labilibaculum filiforme TaxID=1940526 RepID=A0A2N3I3A4_9BACT|nr:hypothetical protein [Labilibaculum filiforme]PKQ64810.1 hypothetical protein BZG02_02870 [Labilibaculum filiforme]